MACLQLDDVQRRTLHEMGIYQPYPSVRYRAQALQQLARVESAFSVHLMASRTGRAGGVSATWLDCFSRLGPGDQPKWNATRQHTFGEMALLQVR